MPFMVWDESMSVGIESIDLEHQQLIDLLNDLYLGVQDGREKGALAKMLDGLILYTRVHFQNEEGYFDKTGYPEAAVHKAEHADLMRQIHAVQIKYERDPSAKLSLNSMTFLRNWLMDHVEDSDKKYSKHLIDNGIR